jgi:hypothetical protein
MPAFCNTHTWSPLTLWCRHLLQRMTHAAGMPLRAAGTSSSPLAATFAPRDPVASDYVPLWCGCCAADSDQAQQVTASLAGSGLIQAGGLATTLAVGTGQQWDWPNAWPPLQHMAIEGLSRYCGEPGGCSQRLPGVVHCLTSLPAAAVAQSCYGYHHHHHVIRRASCAQWGISEESYCRLSPTLVAVKDIAACIASVVVTLACSAVREVVRQYGSTAVMRSSWPHRCCGGTGLAGLCALLAAAALAAYDLAMRQLSKHTSRVLCTSVCGLWRAVASSLLLAADGHVVGVQAV